jgi:hypothetical protein
MKTLTFIGCTLGIVISASACGVDPVVLGELVEASERGDNGSDASANPNAGGSYDPNPDLPVPNPGPNSGPAYGDEEIVEDLLLRYCGACHDGDPVASAAGIGVIGDVDALIELDGGRLNLIVPGNKEDSRIYVRMVNGDMPPVAIESPRPTDEEIEFIGQFIDAMD